MTDIERLKYLAGIAAEYIRTHAPDHLVIFDDADCDGSCLADDIESAIEQIT
jgi:hypothetical protein